MSFVWCGRTWANFREIRRVLGSLRLLPNYTEEGSHPLVQPELMELALPSSARAESMAEPFLWAAVPKKRVSHSKKRMRMTSKWLKPVNHYCFCRTCGNPKLLHVLCGYCFKETMRKTAEYRREKQEKFEKWKNSR